MASLEVVDWQDVHYRQATIVDLHAHPSLKVSLFNRVLTRWNKANRAFDPFDVHADFPKLRAGGVDVLLSTLCVPEAAMLGEIGYLRLLKYPLHGLWKRVFARPPAEVAMEMLDGMEAQVRAAVDPAGGKRLAQMVFSVRELDEILAQPGERPIAVIHSVEGGHVLGGSLDNLQRLFDRGVAYLTLAHFCENAAVSPCYPYPESVETLGSFCGDRNLCQGLTPFGVQVIEKMLELGIILDIAHCTPVARRQIYDIVGNRRPIIASHVGAYEINPSPYNLQDWELKKIADNGGLAGVIFMNYWLMPHETKRGINYIARTIEQFVRAAGIEHVGIGTDFDGFTDPPDDLADASQLYRLTQRLLADGYSAEDIVRIWGGNALRVLHDGWGR